MWRCFTKATISAKLLHFTVITQNEELYNNYIFHYKYLCRKLGELEVINPWHVLAMGNQTYSIWHPHPYIQFGTVAVIQKCTHVAGHLPIVSLHNFQDSLLHIFKWN